MIRSEGIKGLFGALTYLTVCRAPGRFMPADRSAAVPFYPVVGLLIGLALVPADWAVRRLLPGGAAEVLLVALWTLLCGGLHLDGVADALDGLGGGWTREQSLAIMRDSRIGVFGAAGIALLLAFKIACVAGLPADVRWRAFLVAPVIGRLAPLLQARFLSAARPEGQGREFVEAVRRRGVLLPGVAAMAVILPLLGLAAIPVLGGTVVLLGGWIVLIRARLGGVTGDTLGASVELVEAGTLACLLALAAHGWPAR